MPAPHSLELREQVIEAWRAGGSTRAQLAERFGVGIASITRWLRRHRNRGSVEAEPHGSRHRLRIAADESTLAALVRLRTDGTTDEIHAAYRQITGVRISRATVARAVKRLRDN